jgi:hypothetical protein
MGGAYRLCPYCGEMLDGQGGKPERDSIRPEDVEAEQRAWEDEGSQPNPPVAKS